MSDYERPYYSKTPTKGGNLLRRTGSNKCGVCHHDRTLFLENAQLRVEGPDHLRIYVQCSRCHNWVIVLFGGDDYDEAWVRVWRTTGFWRRLGLVIHQQVAKLLR